MESRVDVPFHPKGHGEIQLVDIAESNITIYKHELILKYTITGDYIQKIYEYEPIHFKMGFLYKNGEVEIDEFIYNRGIIEDLDIVLVNKNILALNLNDYTLLINLVNGENEKTIKFPYFFCYDEGLYLDKNTILIFKLDKILEYTIINKDSINIRKYEYSEKKIFDFSENVGLKELKWKIKLYILYLLLIKIILKFLKY